MTPERWQQVKEIFHSTLALEPQARAKFLDKACAGHDSLRREVESLVKAHERSGSFINSPAYKLAAESLVEDVEQLSAGARLGSYKVIRALGSGGMGEVYLAEDERLGRKVALKLLPAHFTKDRERLRRFTQEARAASSLNHPNILTIFEIGQDDEKRFIATEYIEGLTLRQHMMSARVKIEEILEIGIQIASALQAAHGAGIIHRDIKPENIMLREDGYVKVLDFGLAKLINHDGTDSEGSTVARLKTESGMVMGTISYMSPEQARGLTVDARTDIWSLGCVLYEMVGHRAPFEAETPGDAIVAILEKEPPPLAHLEPSVPEAFEWIVSKALIKEREDRYQTIREMHTDLKRLKQRLEVAAELKRMTPPGDVSAKTLIINDEQRSSATKLVTTGSTVEIESARDTGTHDHKGNRKRAIIVIASVLMVICALGFVLIKYFGRSLFAGDSQKSVSPQLTGSLSTTKITYSSGLDIQPTLSPDANSIAYSSNRGGNFEIYVKQLAAGGREIQLTSDGQQNFEPALSPDGTTIAYYSKNRGGIWIVPSLGGVARQLTESGSHPAWSRDGTMIAFQTMPANQLENPVGASTIWIVPARGGAAASQVTEAGNPPGGHVAPAWSPDGKRILFISNGFAGAELWSVSVQGKDLKRLTGERGRIVDAIYAPDGQSLYYASGTTSLSSGLWRLKISPDTGEALEAPVMIANAGAVNFRNLAISADGKKLAYAFVSLSSNLQSVPISKDTGEATGPPLALTDDTSLRNNLPIFSPDGRKIAFATWRAGTEADIWVMDADGKTPIQLTTDPAIDFIPSWFPDSTRIAFFSNRSGHWALWSTSVAGGKETLLLDVGQQMDHGRLSPDGQWLTFNSRKGGPINIWKVALSGGEPVQLTFDKELMGFPCWSPDGQWLAFEMKRGEDSHIAIIPSAGGTPTQLTFDRGDSFPHSWSPDGNRIVFAGLRNGVWNLYWVARDGRTQKQLTNYSKLNAFVRYPSWSPLGDRIVYEYAESKSNIWLMDLK